MKKQTKKEFIANFSRDIRKGIIAWNYIHGKGLPVMKNIFDEKNLKLNEKLTAYRDENSLCVYCGEPVFIGKKKYRACFDCLEGNTMVMQNLKRNLGRLRK